MDKTNGVIVFMHGCYQGCYWPCAGTFQARRQVSHYETRSSHILPTAEAAEEWITAIECGDEVEYNNPEDEGE